MLKVNKWFLSIRYLCLLFSDSIVKYFISFFQYYLLLYLNFSLHFLNRQYFILFLTISVWEDCYLVFFFHPYLCMFAIKYIQIFSIVVVLHGIFIKLTHDWTSVERANVTVTLTHSVLYYYFCLKTGLIWCLSLCCLLLFICSIIINMYVCILVYIESVFIPTRKCVRVLISLLICVDFVFIENQEDFFLRLFLFLFVAYV